MKMDKHELETFKIDQMEKDFQAFGKCLLGDDDDD
ncbi:Protein of unknown function [Lactobacillus equicursoris DSM 19284 = JCM 14600 = CIP 110162]|nr:Protein of unknown function [Lactobacillus equicursoris DSM 19284 = JCM 14600 = CIP 110162]